MVSGCYVNRLEMDLQWKQIDELSFIAGVPARSGSDCGCHWCCSLNISTSSFSGNSVGFYSLFLFHV